MAALPPCQAAGPGFRSPRAALHPPLFQACRLDPVGTWFGVGSAPDQSSSANPVPGGCFFACSTTIHVCVCVCVCVYSGVVRVCACGLPPNVPHRLSWLDLSVQRPEPGLMAVGQPPFTGTLTFFVRLAPNLYLPCCAHPVRQFAPVSHHGLGLSHIAL